MFASSFSLAAVGDLVPSRRLPQNGEGGAAVQETVGYLKKATITFGDLEMPLAAAGAPREKFIAFHARPEIVEDLPGLGFDVLSLANNHSLDYGVEALNETMAGLDRMGIRHLGAGNDLAAAERAVVCETAGGRVGFLAWTCLLPTGAAASPERPGLAPIHVHSSYQVDAFAQMEEPGNPPLVRTWTEETDLERAVAAVRELRSQVDFLAVSIHMGYGAGEDLAEYQQPLCRALIDAGADVILGNHVHAIHGIEVYKGKAILYSPGNFIAQQPREGASPAMIALYDDMSKDGYLAWFDVDTSGGYTVRLVPTVTNDDGLPETVRGADADRIAERIQRLSALLDTKVERDGDQLVVQGIGA
jgi:poly-gamma-glutamate capsule biosynthesis protein CapA/YwtB (metallophosphatase superfamily)